MDQSQAKYLVLTGPESTGKTTLSNFLSLSLGIEWVPEYSRIYLEKHGPNYVREDLNQMICESIIERNKRSSTKLILDTDEITYQLWSDIKYKSTSDLIIEKCKSIQNRLYLLSFPDFPWENDPLRENPDDRSEIFSKYESYLFNKGFDYFILCGSYEVREMTALKIAKEYFK